MWHFLGREANWTEIVTNTLALGFSLMTIVAIAYSVMVRPEILTAVGSVTSGITGVILGFYFNRERLKTAQRRADLETTERRAAAERASLSEQKFAAVSQDFWRFVVEYEQYLANQQSHEEQGHGALK